MIYVHELNNEPQFSYGMSLPIPRIIPVQFPPTLYSGFPAENRLSRFDFYLRSYYGDYLIKHLI